MWKVGLIGTGYWSEKHLNAWARIENVEIAALCNRTRGKLEQRAGQYSIPPDRLYTSVEEMLQRADIHIVDIVTGPETHLELVTMAAKAGKHILCQKPFALSLEEAYEMVRITRDHNVRLMVTENWRWLQPFQIIKRAINARSLGRIHSARYAHSDYYTPRMMPDIPIPQPFFRSMPKLLFYEMGAHWFDTWRYLFGEPSRLYAETQTISPYIQGEDAGVVMLGYDSGFCGVLDASWATRRESAGRVPGAISANHKETLIIEGEEATLKMDVSGKISLIDPDGQETVLAETTDLDHGASHYRLQKHFIECLDHELPFQTSGEDNLRTLELIFGTYESARNHQVKVLGDSIMGDSGR
ncbi:Gfo/Idh/MocA family protein [Cohnella suwonensis]|uniref:Gfo/Idh/MocA family protein n=1 Tax=Cohnella suwonensis TaxID=696072 RepID=A0ABW0M3X2_9BACL